MIKFVISGGLLLISNLVLAQTTTPSTLDPTPGPATTISTPATTAIPQKKSFTWSYVAESYGSAEPINSGNFSDFVSEQHFGLAYRLSDTQRIQLRQYFLYNATDYQKTNEWDIGDTALHYTDSSLFNLPDPISFYARLYFPGSDFSRQTGKYELRLLAQHNHYITPYWVLNYIFHSRSYAYTGTTTGLTSLRLFPALYLNYERNKNFAPFVGVYTEHRWRHTGLGINYDLSPRTSSSVNSDSWFHCFGINTKPMKNVSLNLYSETEDSWRDGEPTKFLGDQNTIYYLDLIVSM